MMLHTRRAWLPSFWLEDSPFTETESIQLRGETHADVCIVGGGFLGLWTALSLKAAEPSLRVVLLEAARCGSGASGRNGGFVMSWWSKYETLRKVVGTEEAIRLARASERVPGEIGEFCAAHGVGFQVAGWAWTASNESQQGAWTEVVDALAQQDAAPFRPMSREEAVGVTGSSSMLGGIFESTCATVQPAHLALALRKAAIDEGVTVYEDSAVTGISYGPSLSINTKVGRVRAERLVLALGAWTGRHVPHLGRSMIVVASDMIITDPAAEQLDAVGMERGVAISDSRMMVNYFHRTADDRLAFGSAGGAMAFGCRVPHSYDGTSPNASRVEQNMRTFYPNLELPVRRSWRGPVDRSLSGLPFVVPYRPNAVAAAGFSGNGVGPSKLVAQILTSLTLELPDEWARSRLVTPPPGGFPPEPLRYIGGELVRRAVARKETASDLDERVGVVTGKLAGLAPAGLVPTRR